MHSWARTELIYAINSRQKSNKAQTFIKQSQKRAIDQRNEVISQQYEEGTSLRGRCQTDVSRSLNRQIAQLQIIPMQNGARNESTLGAS